MEDRFAAVGAAHGTRTVWVSETSSTNDHIRGGGFSHGDAVIAASQSEGRGQRGSTWSSDPGDNLTLSIMLEPRFLEAGRQFLLSEAAALAVVDTLDSYGMEARIKWPNDIYSDDNKIAGILIENDVMGGRLSRSVVGIGLNVNQRVFPRELPNPVSMSLCTGMRYDLADVFSRLYDSLLRRCGGLAEGGEASIERDYLLALYRLGAMQRYRVAGAVVEGCIRGVRPSGELIVEHGDGQSREYLFKEIEYVLFG